MNRRPNLLRVCKQKYSWACSGAGRGVGDDSSVPCVFGVTGGQAHTASASLKSLMKPSDSWCDPIIDSVMWTTGGVPVCFTRLQNIDQSSVWARALMWAAWGWFDVSYDGRQWGCHLDDFNETRVVHDGISCSLATNLFAHLFIYHNLAPQWNTYWWPHSPISMLFLLDLSS